MSSPLNGKVVWLTGASSGIGEALAPLLSARGARLILSARGVEALERVRLACVGEVTVLPLDLADAASLPAAAEHAWARLGGIDVVIHNAGQAHRDLASVTSVEVDRHLMEVNYFGPVALTKAVLPRMLERRGGQLVVISSLSGIFGVPRLSAYAAAKHALHGFFESLRAETHARGLRISMIVPGFVKTPITVNALTGDGQRHGKMDAVQAEGISAEACAAQVLRAVEAGREEALIGRGEMVGVWLSRWVPGLWRAVMRNHPIKTLRRALEWAGLRPRGVPALPASACSGDRA